jgi:hypothetical protein
MLEQQPRRRAQAQVPHRQKRQQRKRLDTAEAEGVDEAAETETAEETTAKEKAPRPAREAQERRPVQFFGATQTA